MASTSYPVLSSKGESLLQRAEFIYSGTQQLLPFLSHGKDSPARLACAFTTFVVGLLSCFNGELSGVIPLGLGGKELLNMSRSAENSNLYHSLKNIQADAGMVSVLLAANQDSYHVMEGNLSEIERGVQSLHAQLNEISQLCTEGSEQLQAKKEEALALNQKAMASFHKALKLFQIAQESLAKSSKVYEQCGSFFEQINEIINTSDSVMGSKEKIQFLSNIAPKAVKKCKRGKQWLDETSATMSQALRALSRANERRDMATLSFGQALQLAQDTLHSVREKAVIQDQCQEQVAAARRELKRVKKRSKQIMRLIQALKEDVNQAMSQARGKLSPTEVAFGVTAGVLCAPLGTSAVFVGVGGAYALHHSPFLYASVTKIYRFVRNIPPPSSPPIDERELIMHEFDKASSGWWGYYIKGRPSVTVGTLTVVLGDGSLYSLRFNLNQKDKISKSHLLELYERMNQKFSNGELDPVRCLAILEQLEKTPISRGQLYPSVTGFISSKDPTYAIFALLKELCQERIELMAQPLGIEVVF
jgi:tetratricopeptide (TPR) repeat protein